MHSGPLYLLHIFYTLLSIYLRRGVKARLSRFLYEVYVCRDMCVMNRYLILLLAGGRVSFYGWGFSEKHEGLGIRFEP